MKKKRKRWQRSSYFQLFLFDHVIQKGPPRFVGAGLFFFSDAYALQSYCVIPSHEL
jgi:hypothetical protein